MLCSDKGTLTGAVAQLRGFAALPMLERTSVKEEDEEAEELPDDD